MIEWILFNYWVVAIFVGLVGSGIGAYFMTTGDTWIVQEDCPLFLGVFLLCAVAGVGWPLGVPIAFGTALGLVANNHHKTKAEKLAAEKKRHAELNDVLKREGLLHD